MLAITNIVSDFIFQNLSTLSKVLSTVITIVVGYIFLRILKNSITRFTAEMVEKHYRNMVYRIFQIIVSIIALFAILGIWGVNLSGLLAGAGFMGIVVGFAAQEALGDLISGILMMFSRPFEIGDWIEIGEFSGIVTDITVMNTRIETFGGEVVSVPNQNISSSAIKNISRKGVLRIDKNIGIDYEADPTRAKEIAEGVMKNHPLIMEGPSPRAMIGELGESSVNIDILFWIDDPTPRKRRKVVNDVIVEIKEKFEEEDIGIPFPHQEVIQHEDRSWKLKEE